MGRNIVLTFSGSGQRGGRACRAESAALGSDDEAQGDAGKLLTDRVMTRDKLIMHGLLSDKYVN